MNTYTKSISQAQKQNEECPHRKSRTMWKSILLSLEMSAPKPIAVHHNSAQVKRLVVQQQPNPHKQEELDQDHSTKTASSPTGCCSYTNACYTQHVEETICEADSCDTHQPFRRFTSPDTDIDGLCRTVQPEGSAQNNNRVSSISLPKNSQFYSSLEEETEPPLFDVPEGFGPEFHGIISKADCELILVKDGEYLLRRSSTKKNAAHLILSLRFDGKLKHYQLFYNSINQTYSLGSNCEYFSSIHDLVAKGFVTLYMESRASQYLFQQQLCHSSSFHRSLSDDKPDTGMSDWLRTCNNDKTNTLTQCNKCSSNRRKSKLIETKYNANKQNVLYSENIIESNFNDYKIDDFSSNGHVILNKSRARKDREDSPCSCKLKTSALDPSPTGLQDVVYIDSPYYEVTRTLRRENARRALECEPTDPVTPPAGDGGDEVTSPSTTTVEVSVVTPTSSVSVNDIEENYVKDGGNVSSTTKDASYKRLSKFWIFSSKKESTSNDVSNKAQDPDDISGIPHQFKVQTFNFTWCAICTHFLFGGRRQGVRCCVCRLAAHAACASAIPNDCVPQLGELCGIFGKDLSLLMGEDPLAVPLLPHLLPDTLLPLDLDMVPPVVRVCVAEIEERGLDAEGIYRVSGGLDQIQAARIAIEKGCGSEAVCEASLPDVNAVAGVLKLFFRQLPVPLITARCFQAMLRAYEAEKDTDQVRLLRASVLLLPIAHYHTLLLLLQHFHRIVLQSSSNKMTATSLSVVFAPTLVQNDPAAAMALHSTGDGLSSAAGRVVPPDIAMGDLVVPAASGKTPIATSNREDDTALDGLGRSGTASPEGVVQTVGYDITADKLYFSTGNSVGADEGDTRNKASVSRENDCQLRDSLVNDKQETDAATADSSTTCDVTTSSCSSLQNVSTTGLSYGSNSSNTNSLITTTSGFMNAIARRANIATLLRYGAGDIGEADTAARSTCATDGLNCVGEEQNLNGTSVGSAISKNCHASNCNVDGFQDSTASGDINAVSCEPSFTCTTITAPVTGVDSSSIVDNCHGGVAATGAVEGNSSAGFVNPCYSSSLSLTVGCSVSGTPPSDLLPDHLLCMKYAALEPKVLQLLIERYTAIVGRDEEVEV